MEFGVFHSFGIIVPSDLIGKTRLECKAWSGVPDTLV